MIINILGTDGVGKTTHIYRLMNEIKTTFNIKARVVCKSDMLDTKMFPESKFIGVSYETLAVECLPRMKGNSRAMWLLYMFSVMLGRYTPEDDEIILMDGYWHKHYGTETALGVNGDWIKSVGSIFPAPDFTVFLDIDPEKVLQREGKKIKPYECGLDLECKPESFLEHQRKVRKNLNIILQEYNYIKIDADNDKEIIYQSIKEEVFKNIAEKFTN